MKKLGLLLIALAITGGIVLPNPTKVPDYTTGIPTMNIPAHYHVADTLDSVGAFHPVIIDENVAVFMSSGYDTATALKNRGITVQNEYDATH